MQPLRKEYREIWESVQRLYRISQRYEQNSESLLKRTEKVTRRPFRKANQSELHELVTEVAKVQRELRELMDSADDELHEYLDEAMTAVTEATMLLNQAYDSAQNI